MKNKLKIVLILLLVVIIFMSCLFYIEHTQVKIGNSYFNLPIGCSENKIDENHINITNGNISLILSEYSSNNTDVKKTVKYYMDSKKNESLDCELDEKIINNNPTYKTTILNNTNIVHYWFIKNDKIYEIATHDGNSKTDSIVTEIITSMK